MNEPEAIIKLPTLTTHQSALNEALAMGAINQIEYNAIQEHVFPGYGGLARIAELLGVTKEELRAGLDAGLTISEIAGELHLEPPAIFRSPLRKSAKSPLSTYR